MTETIGVGLLGIGGYGRQHLNVLGTLRHSGLCRLRAVADPFAARQNATLAALRSQGIQIFDDLQELLACAEVEAVFLATPIYLHAPQAIASLRAGKHVYLEKPPCTTLGELAQMKAAQKASGKMCAVGFQMQTHPALRFLKEQLLQGAIGDLERIWSGVRWRRTDVYYNRTPWAGRLRVDGQPVFDGPATNALAHVAHAALFLGGARQDEWAEVKRVRGSLMQARRLESYDSAFIEAEIVGGAHVQLAFTHATPIEEEVVLCCAGRRGSASINWNGQVRLAPHGQTPQIYDFTHHTGIASTLNFLAAVRGQSRPATSLPDALPFLQTVNGALQSSGGIHAFAGGVEHIAPHTPQSFYQVAGLDDALQAFRDGAATGVPLLEAHCGDWIDAAQIGPDLP